VPSSPECAGSAGEGRRRARQCHGLIFIPISLLLRCPLRLLGSGRAGKEGSGWGRGRPGVVSNLVGRDCGSTRVGPQNVGGGSRDPVTRCWECASRGGQTSARKLLPFFLLSVFLRGDI
jgi:hypothetical protein